MSPKAGAASKLPGPATRAEARDEKRELKAERKAEKREAKEEARVQKREEKEEKRELKADRKAEKFLLKVEKGEDSVLAKVLKQESKVDRREAKAERKAEKFLAKTEKLASKAARRAERRAARIRNGTAPRKWLKGPLPGLGRRKRRRSRVERPQATAEAGVCTASDRELWDTSASKAFAADMGACGPSCVGVFACTYACVQRRQPALSDACAEQYAVLAACTRSKCWRVCLAGTHAECGACGTRCNPEFFRVTGLTPWRAGAGLLADGVAGADAARFDASETPLLARGWTLGTAAPLLVLLALCGFLCGRPCYRRHGWRLFPCWRRTFTSARKAKASPGHPRPTPATWTVMEGATIVREPTRLDSAQGWTQRRVVSRLDASFAQQQQQQQQGCNPRSSVDDLRAQLFSSSSGAMSRAVSFEAVL